MTLQNLNELVAEGQKLTSDQKLSTVKLSNYETVLGFNTVIVKRNNSFKTIQAFYLLQAENVYTLDGHLIANRIN